jgi:hypothetical protein
MRRVPQLRGLTAWPIALAITLSAGFAFRPIQAAEGDATDSSNKAKNLARMNCGTRINWISADTASTSNLLSRATAPADDLILDDNTLNCRLHEGENTFLITLQGISLLDRFGFINEQAEAAGTAQISVSNYRLPLNDRNWVSTNNSFSFTGKRFVNVSLVGTEAKYVKVSFQVKKPGTVAGLGLYGQKTLESFAEQQGKARSKSAAYTTAATNLQDNLNFNFANLYARARVVYVSSGATDLAHKMIDDDPSTAFGFSTTDAHPTTVIELSQTERLRRVTAIYEMESGQLELYLLNNLPADLAALNNMKPVVTITDSTGAGKAAADFEPRGARYVALRWTPGSGEGHKGFKISEIAAFSDFSLAFLDLTTMPERLAENSSVPNVPLEPPVVVPVSP